MKYTYYVIELCRKDLEKLSIGYWIAGIVFQDQPRTAANEGSYRVLSWLAESNKKDAWKFASKSGARYFVKCVKQFRKLENKVIPGGSIGYNPFILKIRKFKSPKEYTDFAPAINWDEGVAKIYHCRNDLMGMKL